MKLTFSPNIWFFSELIFVIFLLHPNEQIQDNADHHQGFAAEDVELPI